MQAPSAPASGDKLDLQALNGSLLYITVHEVKRDIETSFGITNAVAASVAVLDGPHKGDVFDDALVFPRVLQSQLAPSAGAADPVVVGRLGQGDAKPGKSKPWLLTSPTADELATAAKYEAFAKQKAAEQEEPF